MTQLGTEMSYFEDDGQYFILGPKSVCRGSHILISVDYKGGNIILSVDEPLKRLKKSSLYKECQTMLEIILAKLKVRQKGDTLIVSTKPDNFSNGLSRMLRAVIFLDLLESLKPYFD
jgi:hypothetical protein